jgi:hypothetical protein
MLTIATPYPLVVTLFLSMVFVFGLVLWRRGYRQINEDDEGTGVVLAVGIVVFAIGLGALLVVSSRSPNLRRDPLIIMTFFIFMIAVGAFQCALAGQGLANGYIRSPGEEARGIAPTSLYTLLLMPTGDAVSKDDSPARFWLEIFFRVGIGLVLVLFLPILFVASRLG